MSVIVPRSKTGSESATTRIELTDRGQATVKVGKHDSLLDVSHDNIINQGWVMFGYRWREEEEKEGEGEKEGRSGGVYMPLTALAVNCLL